MPGGQYVTLGPFFGGMNNITDPAQISDDESRDLLNFYVDIDGSLIGRPPVKEISPPASLTGRILPIGSATFSNVKYAFFSGVDGTYRINTSTWSTVVAGLECSTSFIYNGFIWFVPVPGEATDGGRYDGTTFTSVAAIPRGGESTIYRDRAWIVPGPTATSNQSRLYFSALADPNSWPATNFIDISPGDGEVLIDVKVYNDHLILFKERSTYVLSYDITPSDAILREINPVLGAKSKKCVVLYENSLFVLANDGNVYEVIDFNFVKINERFNIVDGNITGQKDAYILWTLRDHLIVRFNRSDEMYQYHLRSRTWSRWTSQVSNTIGLGIEHSVESGTDKEDYYLCGDCRTSGTKVYKFYLSSDSSNTREQHTPSAPVNVDINCSIQTKFFEFDLQHRFKRLFWWGVEIFNGEPYTGTIDTQDGQQVVDSVSMTPQSPENMFVKFKRSVRFRGISFDVDLKYNGLTSSGPCKLFTLAAIVKGAETLVKRESK